MQSALFINNFGTISYSPYDIDCMKFKSSFVCDPFSYPKNITKQIIRLEVLPLYVPLSYFFVLGQIGLLIHSYFSAFEMVLSPGSYLEIIKKYLIY